MIGNIFLSMDNANLSENYRVYKEELRDQGFCKSEPFRASLDAYISEDNKFGYTGLLECERDLLFAIAERWYSEKH